MGKRKEEHEKENAERWLLTYADMITLLMLFFIVLYSMSNIDEKKEEQLSEGLEQAFDGGNFGVMEMKSGSRGILEGVEKVVVKEKSKGKEKRAKVTEQLKKLSNGNNVMVSENADGIKITLFSELTFGAGKYDLSEEGYDILRRLAPSLLEMEGDIRVEGHTDTQPVDQDSAVQDNWDLSSRRAMKVLSALVSYGIPEDRLSAVAHGSVQPIRPNDTPEGRSYNRRVEIIIAYPDEE